MLWREYFSEEPLLTLLYHYIFRRVICFIVTRNTLGLRIQWIEVCSSLNFTSDDSNFVFWYQVDILIAVRFSRASLGMFLGVRGAPLRLWPWRLVSRCLNGCGALASRWGWRFPRGFPYTIIANAAYLWDLLSKWIDCVKIADSPLSTLGVCGISEQQFWFQGWATLGLDFNQIFLILRGILIWSLWILNLSPTKEIDGRQCADGNSGLKEQMLLSELEMSATVFSALTQRSHVITLR